MMHDFRLALRAFRSWRVGAAAAIATLAVGIGTTTALFAYLHAGFSTMTPRIEGLDAVGRIYAASRALGVERAPISFDEFRSSLIRASSFESVSAHASRKMTLAVGDRTATVSVGEVSADFFRVLRARPVSGRLFSSADFNEGSPVVVSHRTWRTYIEGRPIANAILTIDGMPRTIVGVLPPEFEFSFIGLDADAWIPMVPRPDGGQARVSVIARLKSDRTWAAASAELAALARPHHPNGLWTWTAISVHDDLHRRTGSVLILLFGPALAVLLIGCTNVGCMLLARGIERDVELSVRSALGATRVRIMRQLIAENLLLAGAGGALGGGVAMILLQLLASNIGSYQPAFAARLADDVALLPVVIGLSSVASVLFGLVPALRLSRRDITTALKGGTRPATASFIGYGLRDLVVFVEVATAVVLVVGVALFLGVYAQMRRIVPLFAADRIVAVAAPAGEAAAVRERVAAVPGVAAATFASALPRERHAAEPAQIAADHRRPINVQIIGAAADLHKTIGLPLVRERSFDPAETAGAHVAIVSESVAKRLSPGVEPVGATVTIARRSGTATYIVIGICGDALRLGTLMTSGFSPGDVYVPFEPSPGSTVTVLARASGDPHALVKPIEAAVRAPGSTVPPHAAVLSDVMTFVPPEGTVVASMLATFPLIALLLASAGIFGVVSQSVAQRTTEFGVRMAVGASPAQVLRMVLLREGKLIGAAIFAGAGVTIGIVRAGFADLLAISGADPRLWIEIAVLCCAFVSAAALLATWRIVRLDPWTVLRRS
ncbi:MAG: hypothetical protein A3H96_10345 [Acidobacteria bacterium RIFCSPLOWO2_02_FULL_67_36]|nr:MAG: hypothetical protein A3H96_10345 [Acidobacteria bacterium RIFCSPLOWO2_02_FULL_67_36]OFW24420.1 MAG: hypothetical protein A3G21_17825 [Acidobacteria bacterium RIFCSPLOWO2_12_FULL_66_21]